MKKLLTLLLTLLILVGCGSKTPKWDEVKQEYTDLATQTIAAAQDYKRFTSNDFKDIFNLIKDNLEALTNKNVENAKLLYENAAILEGVAGLSNSVNARDIQDLASSVQDLVAAAYNNDSSLNTMKQEISAKLDELLEWDESMFKDLVIKEKISWNSVEAEYDALIEETLNTMSDPEDVLEHELEEYKNIIVNNAKEIKNGVNEDNKHLADMIYTSGFALQHYTKDLLDYENAAAVNKFGQHTMEYVMNCYGYELPVDYNYDDDLEQARKFTLSVWNEIVMQLRMD